VKEGAYSLSPRYRVRTPPTLSPSSSHPLQGSAAAPSILLSLYHEERPTGLSTTFETASSFVVPSTKPPLRQMSLTLRVRSMSQVRLRLVWSIHQRISATCGKYVASSECQNSFHSLPSKHPSSPSPRLYQPLSFRALFLITPTLRGPSALRKWY